MKLSLPVVQLFLAIGASVGITLASPVVAQPGPQAQVANQLVEWKTAQGSRVIFMPARDLPMVDLAIDVDAGSRWDPSAQSGLASLTASLLPRGVQAHKGLPAISEQAINDKFAELAAQRSGGASLDRASLSFRFLSDADVIGPVTELVSRLLAHPAFDADILGREKNRVAAAIQESLTQPQALATRALWKAIYGAHPYGAQATVESVQSITASSLQEFHQRFWVPSRMRVTLVGDLSLEQARQLADQLFAYFPPEGSSASPQQIPPALESMRVPATRQAIAHPAAQSHIWLGTPAIARHDPDFFALTVGNYILGGGGFVSRLTEEIREKRGLSYSIFSAFQPLFQPGPFLIGLQTQRSKAPEALAVVQDTLSRFLKEGPTEQELKAAQQNLIGGFALRIDTNRKLLDNLAHMNYYDLPLNYLQTWTDKIAAVTLADIRRAMNRAISLDQLSAVVVAGPENFAP